MSFSKKSSTFNSANGLPSQSQVTKQQQFPIGSQSQSNLHSSQQKQQSQPTCSWSAHTSPHEQSPSPFLRHSHALTTTATATGELFLFGGFVHSSESASNDLYMISTRDFSATLLKTSGDVPDPRYAHGMASMIHYMHYIFSTSARRIFSCQDPLQLIITSSIPVSREWTRVEVNGPKPCGRYYHTVTLIGSKLFVFGGWDYDATRYFNDIWAFDLNSCTFAPCFPEPFDQICPQ